MWNHKRPRIATAILRIKIEGVTLSDTTRLQQSKLYGTSKHTEIQTIEQKASNETYVYMTN